MGLSELIPPAARWTVVLSGDVVPPSGPAGRHRWGRALVGEGCGGADVPLLSFAWAQTATAGQRLTDLVLYDANMTGVGVGAPRHPVLARGAGGWRVAGTLTSGDGGFVTVRADHRYGLVIDDVVLGELGRVGAQLFWAPVHGPGLMARARQGGIEPAALGRNGPEMQWSPRHEWGEMARTLRRAPATLTSRRRRLQNRQERDRWLEQSHDMAGTWDVWDVSGRPLVTVCPPGGAHYSRWAVLPQQGTVPPEAVLLALYVVFAADGL